MRVIKLPLTSGAGWFKQSFAILREQPAAWVSLCSAWALLSILLLAVPLLGAAVSSMLQPGFFAGFVLACRDQRNGQPVTIAHLFAGFRASGRILMAIGAMTLMAETLVLLAFSQFGLFDGFKELTSQALNIEAMSRVFAGKESLMMGALVCIVLVKAALWFAPAMVIYREMPASHAIRWSVMAAASNPLPLLLFAAGLFATLMLATLPWLLGLLVWFPLFAIAHYTSFMETFDDSDEVAPTT